MLSKIFLLLLNRIFSNNISLCFFSLLLIGLTIFLHKFYKKLIRAGKSLKLWRILCFIPLALALFHFAFFRIMGNFWSTRYYFMWLYIASLVLALPALTSLWPRINKILHPLIMTFSILSGLYTLYKPLVWDSAMRNHTKQNYVKSFISTTKDMEKYYSLKDWKKIDIPALRKKFLPVIQKAQDTKNPKLFAAAIQAYAYYGEFFDVLSYFTNHNPQVRRHLIKELDARKAEGMKKLIIDARSNQGGYWAEGVETASLFTKEPFEMARRGTELFGKPQMIHTVLVEADGRFSDIEVILLVDMYCVSAGDSLVKVLSQCPNVTVMGLMPSNCSCQETGGISFLSDGICWINYPVNWLYELDGRRYIDTDDSRECTLPLDVQIPLTKELVHSLYTEYENRDVILDYVIEYLK